MEMGKQQMFFVKSYYSYLFNGGGTMTMRMWGTKIPKDGLFIWYTMCGPNLMSDNQRYRRCL